MTRRRDSIPAFTENRIKRWMELTGVTRKKAEVQFGLRPPSDLSEKDLTSGIGNPKNRRA